MWPGIIEHYASYLPISEQTPRITLNEGNTPLVPLPTVSRSVGCAVYAKYEGLNPTGSFKDRGMTMAVSKAVEEGAQAAVSYTHLDVYKRQQLPRSRTGDVLTSPDFVALKRTLMELL